MAHVLESGGWWCFLNTPTWLKGTLSGNFATRIGTSPGDASRALPAHQDVSPCTGVAHRRATRPQIILSASCGSHPMSHMD
eukprot:1158274-Pelagomonas_calceolata.AAC.43